MLKYTHRAEPLLNRFTSIEALRWTLFVRNIEARGWELHLRDSRSGGNQTKLVSHVQASECEELDILKAMVKRMQVDLEAMGAFNMAPLHLAAREGHLPAVQYVCEHGADKDARGADDGSPKCSSRGQPPCGTLKG